MITRGQNEGQRAPRRREAVRPCLLERAGFSLLELLITLALIIALSVLFYGFGSRSNQQRQIQSCQKNLQTIYLALDIFANEHQGHFPTLAGSATSEEPLSQLVPKYTTASDVFVCPGSKDSALPSGEPFRTRRISYAYFMGRSRSQGETSDAARESSDARDVLMSDRLVDTLPKAKGAQAFSGTGSAPGNNHHKYGGNFLFVDGHQQASGPIAPFSLVATGDVVLLNPRP